MSNDDKRRRRDGLTAQLSVADLLARREAETQPIPRITDDEETVRFSTASLAAGAGAGTNLSGRELHITELLRREGRAGEEERGGGFSVPKLVAMAGGGVVLAGTVAFTASNLLSSPDERPLAEVRFDARPAARATNTLTKDLGAAAAKQQEAQQTQAETTTTTPEQTQAQQQTQAQRTQRTTQQPTTSTTSEQPSTTQAPATSSSTQQQTTTVPPSTTTTTTTPSSTSTPPPSSSSTPPSSSNPSTPPPSSAEPAPGVGVGLDLGGLLKPIGGFDFFAPAN